MNMHGTRSVQKLIDCMQTDEQIELIIKALKGNVVKLIKDLNGNHVIQKCLNKLPPEQNQVIFFLFFFSLFEKIIIIFFSFLLLVYL